MLGSDHSGLAGPRVGVYALFIVALTVLMVIIGQGGVSGFGGQIGDVFDRVLAPADELVSVLADIGGGGDPTSNYGDGDSGGDSGSGGDGGGDSGGGGDGGGSSTPPTETYWDVTVVSATFNCDAVGCHQDWTTASDPKAKVDMGGAHGESSDCDDCVPDATWNDQILTHRLGSELIGDITVDMDDYDDTSWDDDMGECDFTLAEAGLTQSTVTFACNAFDVTFAFTESSQGSGSGSGSFTCGGEAESPATACNRLSSVGVTEEDARQVCDARDGCRWRTGTCVQDSGADNPGLHCGQVESIGVASHTNPAGICEVIQGCSVEDMGSLAGSCSGSMTGPSELRICNSVGSQEVCNSIGGCSFGASSAQCTTDQYYTGDFAIQSCSDIANYEEDKGYSHKGMCQDVLEGCSWSSD